MAEVNKGEKWERKMSLSAPKIVQRATSKEASERYVRGIARYFNLSPEDVRDEDALRVKGLKESIPTPEAFLEKVKGKGPKWYENTRAGFKLRRVIA